ncbi:MAG: hypothetical protein H0T60_08105 [Acidobacteria bacterium]|nr:hypothetical protein [Acidobacteriota bacterium]
MADDNNQRTQDQPQVKQGAVTARRLKVGGGFRGAFLDARFDNSGESVEPVSPETESALKRQFPKARISSVSAESDVTKK